uniref:Uncharacterized protein n=1 Tax=Schistocephalus solidus TaxID=70667 RepID=A0A0X3PSN1_SCHSO
MRWRSALCFQTKHCLGVVGGRLGETDDNVTDREEYLAVVRSQVQLANSQSHCSHLSQSPNIGNGYANGAQPQHGTQNGFINMPQGGSSRWTRLDNSTVGAGFPTFFTRVSRLLTNRSSIAHAARAPNKSVEAVRSRTSSVASDGYINHGFVDSPRLNDHHPDVPIKQLAAFHRDLVSVRSDLLRLQEMVRPAPVCSL